MFEIVVEDELKLVFPHFALADELYKQTDKNRVFLRKTLPWLDQTQSPEDTKAFIRFAIMQFADGKGMECVIRYQGHVVGMVGFHFIDKQTLTGHIGYWLDEETTGNGIMTKCVRKLISIGFKQLGLKKVEIHCAVENTRSRAVPERLSLKQEGIIRRAGNLYGNYSDHVVYGVLDNEWIMN